MESRSQSEQQQENMDSTVLEKYEKPQVFLCDIKDTSNGAGPTTDAGTTASMS